VLEESKSSCWYAENLGFVAQADSAPIRMANRAEVEKSGSRILLFRKWVARQKLEAWNISN